MRKNKGKCSLYLILKENAKKGNIYVNVTSETFIYLSINAIYLLFQYISYSFIYSHSILSANAVLSMLFILRKYHMVCFYGEKVNFFHKEMEILFHPI